MKLSGAIKCTKAFFLFVIVGFALHSRCWAQAITNPLVNFAFGNSTTSKVGFAAIGLSTNDYWNALGLGTVYASSNTLSNVLWSDATGSGISVTENGANGTYSLNSGDPMYDTFFDGTGPLSVIVSNLPTGTFDFFLYGHGGSTQAQASFQLLVGTNSYGTLSEQVFSSNWDSDAWQEGVQYVVFRNVPVSFGQAVTVTSELNPNNNLSAFSGMQICGTNLPFVISTQPQSQHVYAGTFFSLEVLGASVSPLQYQWYFNGQPLSGATNPRLGIASASTNNMGNYFAVVSSAGNSITSAVAFVSLGTPPINPLINVNFGSPSSNKVGFAAVGLTTNDYWNGDQPLSALNMLYWSDGTSSGVGIGINAPFGFYDEQGLNTGDGMYDSFIEADELDDMTVTVNNLPPGIYDFYLYGHGPADGQIGTYGITSAGVGYPTKSTAATSLAWHSDNWQEGLQYVVIRSVAVSNGQPVSIDISPNGQYPSIFNGLQISGPIPPAIVEQPQSEEVEANTNVTFAVVATGYAPLSYQWSFNGVDVPGATNTNFTVTNAEPSNAGAYSVTITNVAGAITSSNANLTVDTISPSIVAQPQDQTVDADDQATFNVSASGTTPFGYQWFFNGNSMPGATGSSLTLSNVQTNNEGAYSVLVTNSAGAIMSSNATLSVNFYTPSITTQPLSQTENAGTNVTFSTAASGTAPVTYQWLFNASQIPGATNAVLTLVNVQSTNAGTYTAVASNLYGSATSSNANLAISPTAPSINLQPAAVPAFLGQSISFSVVASGSDPLVYQWQFNGTNLSGATNVQLALTNVQLASAGLYQVIVSNSVGAVASSNALLSISTVAAWGDAAGGATNVPPGLTNVIAVAGGYESSLALKADGTLSAWGYNSFGLTNIPNSLTNVVSIACGQYFDGALTSNGTVLLWGGLPPGASTPTNGLSNVVALALGDVHCLALYANGTVAAWGQNNYGQTNVPGGLSNVVAIAAGAYSSIALRSDGTIVTWGENLIAPTNLSGLTAITEGSYNALAIKSDGTVAAWGITSYGELNIPMGLTSVVAIAAGSQHVAALQSNGKVVCWGENSDGQTNVPSGLTNVDSIAAGRYHNLALIGFSPPSKQALLSNITIGTNGFAVNVPTRSGRVYRLQYKNSLTDTDWTSLPLVAGTGGTIVLTDPGTNLTQRFYRVQRW